LRSPGEFSAAFSAASRLIVSTSRPPSALACVSGSAAGSGLAAGMIETEGDSDCMAGEDVGPAPESPPEPPPRMEKSLGALQPQLCGTEAFGFL
jgi:hypothetical protein